MWARASPKKCGGRSEVGIGRREAGGRERRKLRPKSSDGEPRRVPPVKIVLENDLRLPSWGLKAEVVRE